MTKTPFFRIPRSITTFALILSYLLLAVGCSEDAAVQDVLNQIPGQKAFLADHPAAESASGTWDWNEGSKILTVSIENSQFDCEFVSGEDLQFKVSELEADTMVFTVVGDEESAPITWTRVGSGTDFEGDWTTEDDGVTYLLSLQGDGTAVFSLDGFDCDRDETANGYEVDGCWVDYIPNGTASTDGKLEEWGNALVREDPAGDATQLEGGTDITGMYVIANDSNLGLRIDFADSVTLGPQLGEGARGVYEIAFRAIGGQSGIQLSYEPEFGWTEFRDGGSVKVANDTSLEISMPWSMINGRSQITELSINVADCAVGPCRIIDEGPCVAEPGDTSGDQ